jgi:hypothetical protein
MLKPRWRAIIVSIKASILAILERIIGLSSGLLLVRTLAQPFFPNN